jgi:hypothetical protein
MCANPQVLASAEQNSEGFRVHPYLRSPAGAAAQPSQSADQLLEIIRFEEQLGYPVPRLGSRVQLDEDDAAQSEIAGEVVEVLDMAVVLPMENMVREHARQAGSDRSPDRLHGLFEIARLSYDKPVNLFRVAMETEFVTQNPLDLCCPSREPIFERHDSPGRSEFFQEANGILLLSRGWAHYDIVPRCGGILCDLRRPFFRRSWRRLEKAVFAIVRAVLVKDLDNHGFTPD